MKGSFILFVILFIALQSCNVNSEIVYHQDASSTSVTDIDTREFMAEMKAMTPDSLKQQDFGAVDKLPTTWTSMYDLEKNEGRLKTSNPDTIRIMKKVFMKSKKENNEPAGFAFKLERFKAEDYKALENYTKGEKLPLDQNIFNDWDGKKLTIHTDNFNLRNIEETLRTKSLKEETDKMEGMMMMFFRKVGTTLKFENKIRSITGKHDWLRQTDDYSVRIEYDLKAMYDKDAKLKNADKKIVIVTE